MACVALCTVLGAWLAGHMRLLQWDNDEGMFAMAGWAMSVGYRPYVDFWIDQPPGGPALLGAVYRVVGPTLDAARGAMLVLALAGATGVAGVARRLGGVGAGLAAIPLLVLAPHFFWLSRSVNLDLPALGLAVLGLAAAWRYRDGGGRRWLVVSGVLVGLGTSIKLHALLVTAPVAVLLLQRVWRDRPRSADGAPSSRAWSAGLAPLLRDGATFTAGVGGVVAAWGLAAPFPAVVEGVLGVMARAREVYPNRSAEYADWLIRENLFGENVGLTALAAFGLARLAARHRVDAAVMAVWLGVTLVALVTQRPVWPKHHWSLVLWPLAVLAGVGAGDVVACARAALGRWSAGRDGATLPRRPARVVTGLAATLAAVAWLAALPAAVQRLADLAYPRQFSAVAYGIAWLAANTDPDATIISDNGLLAFVSGRRMPPDLAVVSSKRIALGDLTGAELVEAAESTQAHAVMIWNNQLTDFVDFVAYLPTRYLLVERVGDDREIWRRFDPTAVTHPEPATVFDVAHFDGYDVPASPARAGDAVTLTLYWRAAGPTASDRTVFAHLVDAEGHTVAQADGPPAGPPTSAWVPGQIVVDERRFTLPGTLAAGTYRLAIGFYDPATLARAGAARPDGTLWPDGAIVLETPVVVRPGR